MKRVLEPEVMDDEAEAEEYAKADFSDSNSWFVEHLVKDYPEYLVNVVDIGCGPADVPIRIAKAVPDAVITAVDASGPMVKLAESAVASAGLDSRIKVVKCRLPGTSGKYDAVLCKDMLHHLPEPALLWNELTSLAKKKTAVYVMDLFRPESKEDAKRTTERIAGNMHPVLKNGFYNSLLAAHTVEEVKKQLEEAGLALSVEKVTDRHLLVKGVISGT